LLHQDGVDLRRLSLTEHKRDLTRLCRVSRTPFLKQVETFPDGAVLFDHCNKFGFEGVVSKLRAAGYTSGLSRHWVKTKCPDWKRDNAERWRIFNQPEQTERQRALARKREDLARLLEQLRTPGLDQGIARDLLKQAAILEREIAELEQT
jgi:hypothetical protein